MRREPRFTTLAHRTSSMTTHKGKQSRTILAVVGVDAGARRIRQQFLNITQAHRIRDCCKTNGDLNLQDGLQPFEQDVADRDLGASAAPRAQMGVSAANLCTTAARFSTKGT
jgi:hypothetical protein